MSSSVEINPYLYLQAIIDSLNDELRYYKNIKGANQSIIRKRENLIQDLNNVLNLVEQYNYDNVTMAISSGIKKMQEIDKEIGSVVIKVNYRENTDRIARLELNVY